MLLKDKGRIRKKHNKISKFNDKIEKTKTNKEEFNILNLITKICM